MYSRWELKRRQNTCGDEIMENVDYEAKRLGIFSTFD